MSNFLRVVSFTSVGENWRQDVAAGYCPEMPQECQTNKIIFIGNPGSRKNGVNFKKDVFYIVF